MRLELVVAACIVRDGQILLIWHMKHQEWLPPGGHIDANETPDEAAIREVREETGLEVELIESQASAQIVGVKLPTPFFADVHNVGDHDHCCFYYLARLKRVDQPIRLNLREAEDFRWFKESELSTRGVPPDVRDISRLALVREAVAVQQIAG